MAFVTDIGIDLGTTNIVVYVRGRGIVLREPAMIAYDRDAQKIRAFGEEARQMVGRSPNNISCIRPMHNGVISDYLMTEQLLGYFIQKGIGRKGFIKPRIVISVSSKVTEVEKRAVEEASYQAGAKEVFIVQDTIAAAIGAGIDVNRPEGNLVVDIGGGATNIAIITLGGISRTVNIEVGGNQFTEAIAGHIKNKNLLFIGEETAESIKIKIGSIWPYHEESIKEIKGRNMFTGLPEKVRVKSSSLVEPMQNVGNRIVEAVCSVLEQTTPELASDIARRGIVLTGGGAKLRGIEDYFREKTGIETLVAERPEDVVALGTGGYLRLLGE